MTLPCCVVPKHEIDEVRLYSESIERAVLDVLVKLVEHPEASPALATELAEIASSAGIIRHFARRMWAKPAVEVEGDDDEPRIVRDALPRTHEDGPSDVYASDDVVGMARALQSKSRPQ